MVKCFGWLAVFLIVFPVTGLGFTPPPNDGFLTDGAGVLTLEEELNIEDILQKYAELSGTEIAVVFMKNTEGKSMEDAAKDIAAKWRVGMDGEGRGVLLLFSYDDRDLFMVIGEGLQGVLAPDIAQGIIGRDIVPSFRNGRYAEGIEEGVKSVVKHISGEFTSDRYSAAPASLLSIWSASIVAVAGAVVIVLLIWTQWRGKRGIRRRRSRILS